MDKIFYHAYCTGTKAISTLEFYIRLKFFDLIFYFWIEFAIKLVPIHLLKRAEQNKEFFLFHLIPLVTNKVNSFLLQLWSDLHNICLSAMCGKTNQQPFLGKGISPSGAKDWDCISHRFRPKPLMTIFSAMCTPYPVFSEVLCHLFH